MAKLLKHRKELADQVRDRWKQIYQMEEMDDKLKYKLLNQVQDETMHLKDQMELELEEDKLIRLKILDEAIKYSNDKIELQEEHKLENLVSEIVPIQDYGKLSVVTSTLKKANINQVSVKCKAVNKVESNEMKIPQILKREENVGEKVTCTMVQPLHLEKVTQFWSQLDTIPLNLEQETTL